MKWLKSISALVLLLLVAVAAVAQENPSKPSGGAPKMVIESPTEAPLSSKRGPVFIEPTDQLITSVLVGNTTNTSLYLVNKEAAPVHVKSVDAGGKNFTATLVPIQDGRRYEIQVQSAAGLKP